MYLLKSLKKIQYTLKNSQDADVEPFISQRAKLK